MKKVSASLKMMHGCEGRLAKVVHDFSRSNGGKEKQRTLRRETSPEKTNPLTPDDVSPTKVVDYFRVPPNGSGQKKCGPPVTKVTRRPLFPPERVQNAT